MNVYIYDIESFSHDWLVVFREANGPPDYTVIHNDRKKLKDFLSQPDAVFGGFANKHYDDWIIITMLTGGSPQEVNRHSQWILSGRDPWAFPYIEHQRKPFQTFDLKDDISDPGISLKAIEGNMRLPIVESSVPFDIDRPLTPEELDEVIYYCKNDVEATYTLYGKRSMYLQSKITVGRMYGLSDAESVGLTNAKLSAKVLGAKKVERFDEREYRIPDAIDQSLIPKPVLRFFMQINDSTIPDAKLFGTGKAGSKGMTLDFIYETGGGRCPVTYAWGGLHGAKQAYQVEASDNRLIENWDVSSLYPNTMINFNFCSRNMSDPKAYQKIVAKRMADKAAGRKDEATAEKLVINTCYGGMLNPYNDLCDRRNGRAVCITGQIAMTELIVMLGRACRTIDFFNINTDGVAFTIDKSEDQTATETVNRWCESTGYQMERTDFKKWVQKDVNNFVAVKTTDSLKTKGGFVSLYKGGDFKNASMTILHKAVVDYFVNGTPAEETIEAENDIFAFQNIVKIGHMFEGGYQYIGDELVPLQNVDRVYAGKNEQAGTIFKRKVITERKHKDKESGQMVSEPVDPPKIQDTTIPDCPEHPIVDNENQCTIEDIDKSYYVRMAESRIRKFLEPDSAVTRKQSTQEVIKIMTTESKEMNIYQKLMEARKRFLASPVKKSGVNSYAEFKYFELEDIVPVATDIFDDLGLVFLISFADGFGYGRLVNTDNPEEQINFEAPMPDLITNDGKFPNGMNSIQAAGGAQTYMRRYLYYLCLDIVEADAIDKTSGKPEPVKRSAVKTQDKPVKAPQNAPEALKTDETDADETLEPATEGQIKAIKEGLKQLREQQQSGEFEAFIGQAVQRLKGGIDKAEADRLMVEVSDKLADRMIIPFN